MKDLRNCLLKEARAVTGGGFNEKMASEIFKYLHLPKDKSQYNSFDEIVNDASIKMENLILTATNEYTRGDLIAGLLKYVDDNRKFLESKVKEDREDFEKYHI